VSRSACDRLLHGTGHPLHGHGFLHVR